MGKIKLTPRQIQIVTLMKQGHRSERIANELEIMPRTIGTHKGRLKARLNLSSKINDYVLVQKCIELKLI